MTFAEVEQAYLAGEVVGKPGDPFWTEIRSQYPYWLPPADREDNEVEGICLMAPDDEDPRNVELRGRTLEAPCHWCGKVTRKAAEVRVRDSFGGFVQRVLPECEECTAQREMFED